MKIEDLVEGKRYLLHKKFKATFVGLRKSIFGESPQFDGDKHNPYFENDLTGHVGLITANNVEPIEDEISN